jgi:hypothetical protein
VGILSLEKSIDSFLEGLFISSILLHYSSNDVIQSYIVLMTVTLFEFNFSWFLRAV